MVYVLVLDEYLKWIFNRPRDIREEKSKQRKTENYGKKRQKEDVCQRKRKKYRLNEVE
jgi:hypothetical protein